MKTESILGLALVAVAIYKWGALPVAMAPGQDNHAANTAFVVALYQQYLGRGWPLDAGGIEWIRRLDANENTRAEIEFGVANSPEALARASGAFSGPTEPRGDGVGGVGQQGNNRDPLPAWYGSAVGSSWTINAARNFSSWVDSLNLAGYPHITGVVHADRL